ncbi:MAG: dihydroneopterin aldolase [Persicimonas sp.]
MRIFVEQLEFSGHHGVYEEERRDGRRFRADLWVEVSPEDARRAASDELADTVDYRNLAEVVLEVGRGESCRLIERMADEILRRLFARFDTVIAAELTLRKFATGVPGEPGCVGVQIKRSRDT